LTPMARFPNAALGKCGRQNVPYGDGLAQVLHLLPHTVVLLYSIWRGLSTGWVKQE
jgi:hypothetical protein